MQITAILLMIIVCAAAGAMRMLPGDGATKKSNIIHCKLSIYIVLTALFSSCIADTKEYVYEYADFRVILTEQCKELVCMELINRQTSSRYSAVPILTLDEYGDLMEGEFEIDNNKIIGDDILSISNDDIFSCDSLYHIETDSICIYFRQESRCLGEKKSPRRLALYIDHSILRDFIDGDYTLYAVKK